jgi:amphi-Trp domain-containing protein
MSDEKKGVTFEGQMDLAAVQAHLKSLMAGFKAGAIYIQNGGDVVALNPESTVTLELEARRKKDKQSLKLEFKWESAPTLEESTGILHISDKEPEPVLVEEEEA